MPVICPRCGGENRLQAAYCGACGIALRGAAVCPHCGRRNPEGHRFCDACGTPLTTAAPSPTPSTPAAPVVESAPGEGGPQAAERVDAEAVAVAPTEKEKEAGLSGPFVATVLSLAALVFLRFVALGRVPPEVGAAERAVAEGVRAVLERGPMVWSPEIAAPAGMVHWGALWSLAAPGDVLLLRVSAAVAGLLALGALYLLCRRSFGDVAATVAVLLAVANAWQMRYSRWALPTALMVAMATAAFYLLLRALEEPHRGAMGRRLMAAAGAVLGGTIYTQSAAVAVVIAAALVWCWEFLRGTRPWGLLAREAVVYWAAALVVALPLLGYVLWDAEAPRAAWEAVALSSQEGYPRDEGLLPQSRAVLYNTARAAASLLWRTGAGRETAWALDPLTALLALGGLLVGLTRLRERGHDAMWTLLIATVVVAGLTTPEGRMARLSVAAPALFAYAGHALAGTIDLWRGRASWAALLWGAGLLLAAIAAYNLASYFADPGGGSGYLWYVTPRG